MSRQKVAALALHLFMPSCGLHALPFFFIRAERPVTRGVWLGSPAAAFAVVFARVLRAAVG
eukprot:14947726-Alexandrium_andersonii.AAC.1